jgi:hypothetical protein
LLLNKEGIKVTATVVVYQAYGAGQTEDFIDGTSGHERLRLQLQDAFSPSDITHPIPIPTAGYNYSFWAHVYLKITVAPSTSITNIRIYSDGAISWNNAILHCGKRDSGDNGCPMGGQSGTTQYQQSVIDAGNADSGYAIGRTTYGHAYYRTQGTPIVDIAGYTSGAPLTLDNTNTYTTTGVTKSAALQVQVPTNAVQGAQSSETLTFMYNEI